MSSDEPALKLGRYEEIDLSRIGEFPVLARCHALWQAAHRAGGLPAAVDVALVPEETLPYTMLLDYLPEKRDVRVRLAGTYVGERATFADTGKGLRSFFSELDANIVFDSLETVARAGRPSLARRDYVSIEGKRYRYVRLILPVALDGREVSGFFKTIEPSSLEIG
jgi:hypothetical protein